MRKVVFSIVLLCTFVAVSSAYAVSGYKATVSYEGNTIGLLVYYDDSVTSYTDSFNSFIYKTLSDAGMYVSDMEVLDPAGLNQVITTLLGSGPGALGWDFCIGVVVSRGPGVGNTMIRADIYAIYSTNIIIYVGGIDINEMLLNSLL